MYGHAGNKVLPSDQLRAASLTLVSDISTFNCDIAVDDSTDGRRNGYRLCTWRSYVWRLLGVPRRR